jgi:hypothetical protein
MFYEQLAQRLNLKSEVKEQLRLVYEQVGELQALQNDLFNVNISKEKLHEKVNQYAKEQGIHPYILSFYLPFLATKRLREEYQKQNISEKIFFDTVMDLKYMLDECKEVYDIWGTSSFDWFVDFFRLTRFALGRFQYDITTFGQESYTKYGLSIKKGDPAYSCHIPSAGSITKDLRMDSYKKAYEFAGQDLLVIVCDSWLLYPPHREFLPTSSRILEFMNDFDIIYYEDKDTFDDGWRIFGSRAKLPPNQWQTNTSLQKAFAERVQKGLPTGQGFGVLVFDGENIINRNQP